MGALLQKEQETLPDFLQWCNTGDLQKVTEALERDEVVGDANLLNTGLVLAVMKKQNAVAEVLLKQPIVSVNFEDNNKSTALHWACYVDNTWALDQLLATQSLACFNHLNSGGDSPLMVAAGSGSLERGGGFGGQEPKRYGCGGEGHGNGLQRGSGISQRCKNCKRSRENGKRARRRNI